MFRVITITHQPGSGGTELARLVAHKLGWEFLDQQLVARVARVADLDAPTAERFDEQAAHWCGILRSRGIGLEKVCPFVEPRWFGEPDPDAIHALATNLIRAAADFGEYVILARGAQCLLQSRADVFNVLAYAPIGERMTRVQDRHPGCADVQAFLRRADTQAAKYLLEHYGADWLDASLYHLCINTSMGVDLAATLTNAAVIWPDKSCTPTPTIDATASAEIQSIVDEMDGIRAAVSSVLKQRDTEPDPNEEESSCHSLEQL